MIITNHAKKRIKQRAGDEIDPIMFTQHAIERGLKHNELKGDLKKWVDGRVLSKKHKFRPYIYSDYLFLLSTGDVLITIVPVPSNLHQLVAKSFSEHHKKQRS